MNDAIRKFLAETTDSTASSIVRQLLDELEEDAEARASYEAQVETLSEMHEAELLGRQKAEHELETLRRREFAEHIIATDKARDLNDSTTREDLVRMLRSAQADRDRLVHETARLESDLNKYVARVQTLTEDVRRLNDVANRARD